MEGRLWVFRILPAMWTCDIVKSPRLEIYKAGAAICRRQMIMGADEAWWHLGPQK